MLNRMMKTGIASAALAASAVLIAAPASADIGAKRHHGGKFVHSKFVNDWGQSRRQIRRIKRNAIGACNYQLRADARYLGYKSAKVVDTYAQQVGKRRVRVTTKAKLFDGYNVRWDTYSCTVRRGEVVRANGLQPVRFKRGRGFKRNRGFGRAAFH